MLIKTTHDQHILLNMGNGSLKKDVAKKDFANYGCKEADQIF